jgi:regulator of sirC expression with transglutaminase-like and TPR domain
MAMKPSTETELQSLIRLLADDDEAMLAMVQARLLEMGQEVIPALWDARAGAAGAVRHRIDALLARLSGDTGKELALQEWRTFTEGRGEVDLEQGVAAIARANYPGLDWMPYRRILDRMADDLNIRLAGVSEPLDVVETIGRYLFYEEHFEGPDIQDYDPDDSYMNRVIDRRRGLPISLSAVCLLIGQRLSLPLFGVGLPGHFIVKYQSEEAEVLFDPYHKGIVVPREACETLLARGQYQYSEAVFDPYSNRMILARMLGNLRNFYLRLQDRERLATVTHYFMLVTGEGG